MEAELKYDQKKELNKRPVWQLALLDLFLTALVLCIFALFHHVLPDIRYKYGVKTEPVETVMPENAGKAEYGEAVPEKTMAETPVEDEAVLSWRDKFAGHFTEEIVIGEASYSSPNISVAVTKNTVRLNTGRLTYFVADIYISDISEFISGTPQKEGYDSAKNIAGYNDAIIAVNGDFAVTHKSGTYVRNGEIHEYGQNSCDICVLYYDGTVETYGPEEYTKEELLESAPYQIWAFGPELLEDDGLPKEKFNTSKTLQSVHPRSGLGYFEPGHYCFIVADGRQGGYSNGVNMADFAQIFSELGCVRAYNLDGGASSTIVFMGEVVNSPSSKVRQLSDMLIIKETDVGDDEIQETEK